MNKWAEVRLLLDVIAKYIVLIFMVNMLSNYVSHYTTTKEVLNMPDWIVSLETMVFVYFFRKAPRQGGDNGKAD